MIDPIELDDSTFENALAAQPVALVDYYASWCGACRMAMPMFRKLAGELNIPLYKIDAENNPRAKGMVAIENLPTLAVFKSGKLAGSLCTTREESLRGLLKEHGVG